MQTSSNRDLMIVALPETATLTSPAPQFADVLERIHREKKTGLLNITVRQSSQYLVRVYFREGNISRLSYGPLSGKECLDLLDCYDFGKAVFFEGMKAPNDLPATENIISQVRNGGKTIEITQPSFSE